MSACRRSSSVPAGRSSGVEVVLRAGGRASAAARARRGPRSAAADGATRGPSGPRLGAAGARRAAPASASHSAGEGWSRNRWTSRACGERARAPRRSAAARRVRPKPASRSGSATMSGLARAAARRPAPAARPGSAAPIRSRSARHSSACQRRRSGSGCPGAVLVAAGRPRLDHGSAGSGRSGRSSAAIRRDDGQPLAAPALGLLVRRPTMPDRPGQRSEPRLVGMRLDHLQQRPHRALGQPRIPVAGRRRRRAPARRRAAAAAGGNSIPAQIPSLRPGEAPSVADEPLGEPALHAAGGDRDQLGGERIARAARPAARPRASARRSARSARWRWSIARAIYVAPRRCRLTALRRAERGLGRAGRRRVAPSTAAAARRGRRRRRRSPPTA